MPYPKHLIHHKHITRIDHPVNQTHGYIVRIAWNGAKYGHFFSDASSGGTVAALHAAITWRTMIEQQIGKPCSERQIDCVPSTSVAVISIRQRYTNREGDDTRD